MHLPFKGRSHANKHAFFSDLIECPHQNSEMIDSANITPKPKSPKPSKKRKKEKSIIKKIHTWFPKATVYTMPLKYKIF